MEFPAILFCVFFLLVGLMAISTVKRNNVVKSQSVDLQRLRQQQLLMEARRVQRERSQNWFKLGDEKFAPTTSPDELHDADLLPPAPTPEAAKGEQADALDDFRVTRINEAFNTFFRERT